MDSRHFRLERLAAGVHAAVATPTGYGLCNSGIVDLGGATVVFDSMLTPMAGAALARAAEKVTGHPPAWVVNSHWHGDHIWGNSAFANGHVVSSRRVREVVLRRSQRQFDSEHRQFPKELADIDGPDSQIAAVDRPQVRAWARGVIATPRSHRVVPPEVTFRDELVLEGRRRALHLITYGGGHSPSDVFGYLPDERVLFSGDLAVVGYHPSVGDGWPDEWIRILSRMRRLPVDRVVPGHGSIGTRRTLEGIQEYFRSLSRTVAVAKRRGATLREIQQTAIPDRYRRLRFSFMYPSNLARIYRLARGPRNSRAAADAAGSGSGAL
ncbi:MAG: MBL fold metallo-hydrolase [Thermoplasmata archaeon]